MFRRVRHKLKSDDIISIDHDNTWRSISKIKEKKNRRFFKDAFFVCFFFFILAALIPVMRTLNGYSEEKKCLTGYFAKRKREIKKNNDNDFTRKLIAHSWRTAQLNIAHA